MHNLKKKFALIACAVNGLLFTPHLSAKDIYVSQSGSGTTNSLAWANTGANWNGTFIAPGDTLHLVGTFTNALQIQGSGTPGLPITIYFEPGTKFSKPSWGTISTHAVPTQVQLLSDTAIYCVNGLGLHDVVIDGGVDGTIECLNNGNGGTYTNHCSGVWLYPLNNVEVKNLAVKNMCVYFGSDDWKPVYPWFTNNNGTTNFTAQNVYNNWPTPGAHTAYELPVVFRHPPSATQGIRMEGPMTNCSIHNCFVDHAGNGLMIVLSGTASNVQVYSNTLLHCSWGLGWLQSIPDTTCFNSAIWANRIDAQTNWNGNPMGLMGNNSNHGDGMLVNCQGARATNYNMRIYRNHIGPAMGTNMTALIWQETTWHAGSWQNLMIYNNLLRADDPHLGNTRIANGLLGINGDRVRVFNNTFISRTAPVNDPPHGIVQVPSGVAMAIASTSVRGAVLQNNLTFNLGAGTGSLNNSAPFTTVDYNVWWFTPPIDPNITMTWGLPGTYNQTDWNGWKTAGHDAHGSKNRPSLSSNFSPLATDTAVTGKGTNLTSYGVTDDFFGNPRPATGPWTVGAIENTGSTNRAVQPPFLYPPTPVTP